MSETHSLPGTLNASFVDGLYSDYLRDPESICPDWRRYFDNLAQSDGSGSNGTGAVASRPVDLAPGKRPGPNGGLIRRDVEMAVLQDRLDQMVRAYRVRGHMVARVDPLGIPRAPRPELEPEFYGFTEADLDRPFSSRTIYGPNVRTLRQILDRLRNTYCRSIGVQFMHIDDLRIRHWLQDRMEGTENRVRLSRSEQLRILTRLTDAVMFEEFIQKKFIGAKSFSLEGCESLIPLLDLAIERAGEYRIDEIVFGMAHRGRLNVLANIMGKSPHRIFREFEDVDNKIGAGDVKYHLGYSADWKTAVGHKVHLSLCFNPSHLEFVCPVAVGRLRAKQERVKDTRRERGLTVLIHGDAAFAGEGVVQETLNLSELPAYSVGGTIHVIVNNQIGFTTPPSQGRSSLYASGVAKMLQIPIFHVNGEDPEAVAQVIRLAMAFRKEFKRDIVVDMYGYRRLGHNEGDEPAFTQPLLYRAIASRKSVREGYLDHLLKLGEVTREEADRIAEQRRAGLEKDLSLARSDQYALQPEAFSGIWAGYTGGSAAQADQVATAVPADRLSALLEVQTRAPADFHPHPKIERLLKARQEMARGERALDWAAAEATALASLAAEGLPIRMTGQDSARGTFSQRHAVLHDVQDGHCWMPLQHIAPGQAPVEIYNSPLSETGVLGFEYGYSLDYPDGLVVWEAQFGDFVNAAQVIIDQFICSAEVKWHRLSGIVLLLPHGFEGQGPEHSSARMERFLALAAEDNIQVVYPSTPAQYFHMLRRQVLRSWRKPLIVMTPKSLLRHPKCVSEMKELAEGHFQCVIPDDRDPEPINRILLCTGKIYYELAQQRETLGREDVAIVRIEQLYPLSEDDLHPVLAPYPDGTPVFWVQEEPENMGAWRFLRTRFGERLLNRLPLTGIYRPAAASPATGSARTHNLQQKQLIERAFSEGSPDVA